jgi:hypothetical protein
MKCLNVLTAFVSLLPFASSPASHAADPPRLKDERLLGTWQSDADRTIAEIRERKPVTAEQEAALRKLFGKMRITWSEAKYTTELDGTTKSFPYEVLGRDKVSVAIRSPVTPLPPLKLSEFSIIHFEDANTYWLHTQIGDIKEYFKRVKQH